MKILGLQGFGFNPGAALIVDGQIMAHSEEERFTRFKGSHFLFPGKAAAWCLKSQGLTLQDIDYIAWGWNNKAYKFKMPLFWARSYLKHGIFRQTDNASNVVLVDLLQSQPNAIRNAIRDGLRRAGLSGNIPNIIFIPHHLAHAASTYYLSGFDEAAILILDGSGENICTSVYYGKGKDISEVDAFEIPNSLGWFYAAFTDYLGFIPYRDEGKVMALAAYGNHQDEFMEKISNAIKISNTGYRVNPKYTLLGTHNHGKHFSDNLVALFGEPRYYGEPLTQRHKDIAFACQTKLEEAALILVKKATQNGKIRNLCLSGGVALNCKMNGFLRMTDYVDNLFVQPSSSDAGSSLGAAIWLSHELNEFSSHRLEHVYYGSEYSNDEIKEALDIAGVDYSYPDNLAQTIGKTVAEDKIVALYEGRMEFGPRALGHRSILANPMNPDIKHIVNKKVKFREPWRPFCPSLHESVVGQYFKKPESAPFMIVAFWTIDGIEKLIPSVVHVDGSVRPQTIKREIDPLFWESINEYGKITGHPIVLNTSFNVRGEPIVESPQDALRCFFSTGLDALAIGGFWVEKK